MQYLPTEILSNLDEESIELLRKASKNDKSRNNEDNRIETDDVHLTDDDYEMLLITLLASQDENDSKWSTYSLDEFKAIFESPAKLNRIFTVSELKLMASLSDKSPQGYKSFHKPKLVNAISKLYGKGERLVEPLKTPASLKMIVSKHIKSWSIDGLNVAYAQLHFPVGLQEWDLGNLFNGAWNIKTDSRKTYEIEQWYAQPANIAGHYIQPIIDPHHIFVNNRSRCCSKGMSGMRITPEAWWKVAQTCKDNDTGLSWEIAKELKDRQSNAFAQTTFSSKIQAVMESNGDINEAKWCDLLRNWYKAIDDAGVSIDERIDNMFNMRSYLLSFFKGGHFPPVGSYIAGMPIAQFEGILTNIDRRLQLYSMTKEGTYNQRSVSSLDSETFFSGFQEYDPKGTGVLRADGIPVALGTAVFLYQQRLNTQRGFYMKTSQKSRVYPDNPLLARDEGCKNQQLLQEQMNPFVSRCIYIRSHDFDMEQRKTKKPKRKSGTITAFGSTARGAEGARSYHKYNEEKIMAHRRCGIMDDDLFITSTQDN